MFESAVVLWRVVVQSNVESTVDRIVTQVKRSPEIL